MEQNGLLVQVNDLMRDLAGEHPPTLTWDFICECSSPTCDNSVILTLNEFDRRRAASPPVPIHAAGHESRR